MREGNLLRKYVEQKRDKKKKKEEKGGREQIS